MFAIFLYDPRLSSEATESLKSNGFCVSVLSKLASTVTCMDPKVSWLLLTFLVQDFRSKSTAHAFHASSTVAQKKPSDNMRTSPRRNACVVLPATAAVLAMQQLKRGRRSYS